jgi:hypothetical protein
MVKKAIGYFSNGLFLAFHLSMSTNPDPFVSNSVLN